MSGTSYADRPVVETEPRTSPTIWGCTPRQVHDRFWAAFGVQVVRPNEPCLTVSGAELSLLCEPDTLVLFRLSQVIDVQYWLHPRLMVLRVRDTRARAYREVAVTSGDRLVRFKRVYRDAQVRFSRVALTADPEVVRLWQNAPSGVSRWRWLSSQLRRDERIVRRVAARTYDGLDDFKVMDFMLDLNRLWTRPDTTIQRARRVRPHVWADSDASVDDDASFHGTAWIGAGRRVEPGSFVAGPAVLWDEPGARPQPGEVPWLDIEPADLRAGVVPRVRRRTVPGKRAFDVAFALCALAATLPLYPLIAAAIIIEDGRPVLFAHRRETLGGREFPCLKFRSMSNVADSHKANLQGRNQADGPQFYVKEDPRITRVGRVLRKFKLDELPQFLNVLVGHMSIVGPRPSPHDENQISPSWREARLSVRPGITGLWQVMRTRAEGMDFWEWIRYDLEYVQKASWSLDLKILAKTVWVIVAGRQS